MRPQERADFEDYVAARSGALLRTAYLLTGNGHDAQVLLQTAPAKTYLAWGRVREREALDSYVRRVMINTQTSFWRRRRVDEHPTDEVPEGPGRDETADADLHDALWTALSRLPRRQRATLGVGQLDYSPNGSGSFPLSRARTTCGSSPAPGTWPAGRTRSGCSTATATSPSRSTKGR